MMRKLATTAIPIFLFLGIYLFQSPVIQWLEDKSIDWRFSLRGPIAATGDVVVVAIDDKSLAREGRWPWPRETVARLVSAVSAAKPAYISLDIIFAEPAAGDADLAQALSSAGNVALGYYFYQTAGDLKAADIAPAVLTQSLESILPTAFPERSTANIALIQASGVVANLPQLSHAAHSQGYFNAFPDPDGSLRRFPLMLQYRNKTFPAMALEIFSHHENGFDPILVPSSSGGIAGISVGPRLIPTSKLGEVLVNYRGDTGAFRVLSATDVLSGAAPIDALRGKTVVVGATAVGIYDLRVTPVSPNLPGVLVGANLVDMLYRGDFLRQDSWVPLWDFAMLLIVPILLALVLLRARILWGVIAAAGAVLLYGWVALLWFKNGMVVALATPALEWICLAGSVTVYRGLTEERQKRMIRRAFQSYLHPKIVSEMAEHPERLKLGGERMICTMLFCDVKNFSTISEKIEPEKLTLLMNAFFDPICQAIMVEGGYIDKLIGDAVMAVFGAPVQIPNHALQACRAAQAMQAVVHRLEPQFQQDYGVTEFKLRIGIHTGPVVVGNMGTKERLNYTVMGDAVNLASRLEGANKELGTDILLSQATIDAAGPALSAHFVATIQVKGKEEQVKVYTLN